MESLCNFIIASCETINAVINSAEKQRQEAFLTIPGIAIGDAVKEDDSDNEVNNHRIVIMKEEDVDSDDEDDEGYACVIYPISIISQISIQERSH
jgi:hypothetical protein